MRIHDPMRPESIMLKMIAPCGMNCGLCIGHLREKRVCPGCNGPDADKPNACARCRIKICDERARGKSKFCFTCAKFPCLRLRQLDKRYRTKYGMSMLGNLESIRTLGIREFVAQEKIRWKCPSCGGTICVHRENCLTCGRPRKEWRQVFSPVPIRCKSQIKKIREEIDK